jgi:hypothetical protein
MPRPRKTPLVTETETPIEEVVEVVETPATIEDSHTITVEDEIFNFDDLSEPDYDEDLINLVPGKLYYEVFDGDTSLGYVMDESDELLKFLDGNKEELNSWVEQLSTPITDDRELLELNHPDIADKYKSVLQYQNQNGYAPVGPKFKSMMDYYKDKHSTSSDEEIAFAVFGDLRFKFVPVRL